GGTGATRGQVLAIARVQASRRPSSASQPATTSADGPSFFVGLLADRGLGGGAAVRLTGSVLPSGARRGGRERSVSVTGSGRALAGTCGRPVGKPPRSQAIRPSWWVP